MYVRSAPMSDDRVCIHYVLDRLDDWLENTAKITAKVSDVEYVKADDIKTFKSELIFNLGVNQRIARHEDE
jgi:hypothetical protein